MKALLEVKQVSKEFVIGNILSREKILAVDQVSFEIKKLSEIFTLAGESGCGKTTMARMILGFEEPTAGEIMHESGGARRGEEGLVYTGFPGYFPGTPFETFNPLRKVDSYLFETVFNYKLAADRDEAIGLIDSKLRSVGLSYDEGFW